jgi:hypothetical protein
MFNSGMKIYTVHVHPDESSSDFKPVFIKEGFNGMAFVFTIVWALYYRLWALALALILLTMGLMYCSKVHLLTHASVTAIHLGVHLLVGYHANDFLRGRLSKKGYVLADVTAADSFLRAQQRFFERYVAAVV